MCEVDWSDMDQIWIQHQIKNKSNVQKVLGIECDYLVKFIVDEPHLGLEPSHCCAFYHWFVWLRDAFIDFGR